MFLRAEPANFSRAATRFHARVALETGRVDLASSQQLLTALQGLAGADPRGAAADLADLVEELELPEIAARIDASLKP